MTPTYNHSVLKQLENSDRKVQVMKLWRQVDEGPSLALGGIEFTFQ